jgi:hypothetical protein
LFVIAGSFDGHQIDLMGLAEGPKRGDSVGVVGELGERALRADARV